MSSLTDTLNAVCTAQALLDTPLGPVRVARTATGIAGLWFERQKPHPGELAAPMRPNDQLMRRAA